MVADPLAAPIYFVSRTSPLDFFVGHKLEQQIGMGNVEYQAKRASERLQPLRVVYLQPGTGDAYKTHCLQQGQRDDQFKVVKLQYAQDCSFNFSPYIRE